jgi:DoxX-like protein
VNRALWTVQALLALVFLFGGVVKLIVPPDALYQMVPLPTEFVRFIALCETLGAIGLILPSLLRIQPRLTPLAAAGLVIIMTGATALSPGLTGESASAIMPLVLGLGAAFVAFGRSRLVPLTPRASRRRAAALLSY